MKRGGTRAGLSRAMRGRSAAWLCHREALLKRPGGESVGPMRNVGVGGGAHISQEEGCPSRAAGGLRGGSS